MADFLALKGPNETVQRRWLAPVDSDDGAALVAASASGVTLSDYELQGNEVVMTIAAGTAATTGAITVTVTTSQGRVLVETLYIPVAAPGSTAATARNIAAFALRKITGIGEAPDAAQEADALERLSDMLEAWRMGGADVGVTRPLDANSVIYCPEGFIGPIKANLLVHVANLYDTPLTPLDVAHARSGLALIKQANLPALRPSVFY